MTVYENVHVLIQYVPIKKANVASYMPSHW